MSVSVKLFSRRNGDATILFRQRKILEYVTEVSLITGKVWKASDNLKLKRDIWQ